LKTRYPLEIHMPFSTGLIDSISINCIDQLKESK